MKNFLKNNKLNQHGYTIVEIIIVIMVIGILASIVTIGGQGYLERSAEESVKSSLIDAQSEMKKAFNRTGEFPSEVPATANIASGVDITISGDGSQFCITGTSRGASFYISDKLSTPVAGDCSSYTPPDPDPEPIPSFLASINPSTLTIPSFATFTPPGFMSLAFDISNGTSPYSFNVVSADSGTTVTSLYSIMPPEERGWTGGDIYLVSDTAGTGSVALLPPGIVLPDTITVGNSEIAVIPNDSEEANYVCNVWSPGFIAKVNVQVTDANSQTTQAALDIKC